jgi:hypothetical protein
MSDKPRYVPTCPVCERPYAKDKGNAHYLKVLRRRLQHLRDTAIPRASGSGNASLGYWKGEAAALEWALEILEPRSGGHPSLTSP